MSKCICDEMGWVEDCPRHSGAQPARGAPTPVREGAAQFYAGHWPNIPAESDHADYMKFAEAFSAHQNAELRKERDALQELAIELGHTPSQVENLLLSVRAALESTKD